MFTHAGLVWKPLRSLLLRVVVNNALPSSQHYSVFAQSVPEAGEMQAEATLHAGTRDEKNANTTFCLGLHPFKHKHGRFFFFFFLRSRFPVYECQELPDHDSCSFLPYTVLFTLTKQVWCWFISILTFVL